MNESNKSLQKEDLPVLTHEQAFPLHDEAFKRIDSKLENIEGSIEDYVSFKSGVEKSFEFVRERLDARQAQTDAILLLGENVKYMAEQMKVIAIDIKDISKMTTDHEYRISDFEKSTLKDDITFIKTEVNNIKDKVIILENAVAKKVASYVEHGFKAVIVTLALAIVYFLSDGKLGG